jgi:hypothetical protein
MVSVGWLSLAVGCAREEVTGLEAEAAITGVSRRSVRRGSKLSGATR